MPSLIRFALIFLVGCSADTFVAADAGGDASADASDAASEAATDTGGGSDGGKFECNAGTCSTSAEVCCGNFTLEPGAGVTSCQIASASTKCLPAASCATAFPIACSSPGVVRLCAEAKDCTSDPVAKQCCNVFAAGTMAWVCSTPTVASFGFTCK